MKLIWSDHARADLHRIQNYYVERSPRAAQRIWLRIVQRVADQVSTPFAAPFERGGPLRRLVITRTPYLVFYIVEGDEFRVEGVTHASQHV